MSYPISASIPAVALETVLAHLVPLFLAAAQQDRVAAREAALHTIACYHPRTEVELRVAAQAVAFSLTALAALAQSAAPDVPPSRTNRLRTAAVSLNRAANQAEQRLMQREGTRGHATSLTDAAQVRAGKAMAFVEDTRTIAALAEATGLTWTQAYEQRRRDQRLAARLKPAEPPIPNPIGTAPVANPSAFLAAAAGHTSVTTPANL